MNDEELSTLIAFGLSQLSDKNAHHEFEELVRHLVRSRIASNVIPATGPVGAGGDQGRDLETFRTYLLEELGQYGAFLAKASAETLAFACSIQKENLAEKARSDVRTIVSQGSDVDRIYCFFAYPMPVGVRHRLQEQVREEHGVELEVFDRAAIAQELCRQDTFWIAEKYLSLPADVCPDFDQGDLPEEYNAVLQEYRERQPNPTFADFGDIKAALRKATFDEETRADL